MTSIESIEDPSPIEIDVSIVVVAREGFARAPQTLRRLLESTQFPFKLIYVDGGAPLLISKKLKKMVLANCGTYIRANRFLKPTTARNLGFQEVDTRYTVFLDNDVFVTEGWLRALVECADETRADYVSPVIRQAVRGSFQVHIAGGQNAIIASEAGSRFDESYDHMHDAYDEVVSELTRKESSMAEFHTILVRTDTLRRIGGLDERCSTAFEHNDLCLMVQRLSGKGWLEPTSIVDYAPDKPALYGNFSYCLLRWSRRWINESHTEFCAKWGLRSSDPGLYRDLYSLHSRRRQPLRFLRGAVRRIGGDPAVKRVDLVADWIVDNWLARLHDSRNVKVEVMR